MQQSDAINDPIFANILLGGKFGLLDFHLPRALAKLLPFAQQTLILRPLQLVLLGAALLSSWGLHHYGVQGYLALQQYRIAQDNARWQVSLHYQSTTQALAEALSNTLQTARFSATVQSDAIESDDKTNVIRYAVGGKKAAERVARSLAWLTYGLEAEPIETTRLPAGFLQVQLNQTYQPGVGFSDELRYQTKEKPYISERIRDVESGNNVCNTAGQADSYVFALSWLPAFCEMKPEKFECQTADPNVYQAKHFTLLGLWPNKKSCGVNYGYCGEIKVAKQNFCEYPEINLDSISRAAIAKVMPGAIEGSCLERHQWYKHGTCQIDWSMKEFFDLMINLTHQFNSSGMADFMSRKIGQEVSTEDFLNQIAAMLGSDARDRIRLICNRGMLEGIKLNLSTDLALGVDLKQLIRNAPIQGNSNCGETFRVDSIGQQS
ncbi:MAG: hypothetical protein E6Q62_11965 [Nitrosomonas sp.]|nr:MAG: hypothetical protein E6Q62_11965 [Nitrosomonas sp.]